MGNSTRHGTSGQLEAPLEDLETGRDFFSSKPVLYFLRLVLLILFLSIWEFASGWLIESFWVSKPSAIFLRLYEWLLSGFLVVHIEATLLATFLGFGAGAIGGILLGLILGGSQFLADVTRPFIMGFMSIPKVAFAPLFIFWFGIGLPSILVLVAVTVFFPVFFNTFAGVHAVERQLVDTVRIFGAGRLTIFYKVVLPASATWIFAGLKIAIRYALTTTIYGELIGGNRGLGYVLQYSSGRFDTRGVMVAIFVLGICGWILFIAVERIEASIQRWKT